LQIRYNPTASRFKVPQGARFGSACSSGAGRGRDLVLASDPSAPKFCAGVLIYGIYDFPSTIERSASQRAIEGMARGYLGAQYPAALKDPRVSPLRAIKPGTLPPCFVICGAADALLPESRSIRGIAASRHPVRIARGRRSATCFYDDWGALGVTIGSGTSARSTDRDVDGVANCPARRSDRGGA